MDTRRSTMAKEAKSHYKPDTTSSFAKKIVIPAGLLFVSVIASMVVWTGIQKRNLRADHFALQQDLKKEVRAELDQITRQSLTMMAKPYGWAVKQQILLGNLDAIHTYGERTIEYTNFISVMVINERGTIIASTDNVYEGKKFISFNSPYYLNVDSTVLYKATADVLTMAIPIMDMDKKLGTVVINYLTDNPKLF